VGSYAAKGLPIAIHNVLLLGGGKIGRMIARFLTDTADYRVRAGDVDREALRRLPDVADAETMLVDAASADALSSAMLGCQSVISALNYRYNPLVAKVALDAGASYFDLTEDVETAGQVRQVARNAAPGQIFMPQCGLAPGFISILASHLAKRFDALDAVHMRVGALPQFPSNALNYNLTWSTDGLINEYCNPCEAIHEGRRVELLPLEGLESFSLDGVRYEAFNTSGGLGTLCETLEHRVRELNYRTVRYAGHRDLMVFLVNDLRLGQRRSVLKDILENAIPITFQDVVVIFCAVTGWTGGRFVQISDARKVYGRAIGREPWSAIQITTAAGVCGVLDLHAAGKLPDSGFVKQEDANYDDFVANRFGQYFLERGPERVDGPGSDLSSSPLPAGARHSQPA
jgi:saccharopine dehydrogenase-like NADP-dependent oxidoreductase